LGGRVEGFCVCKIVVQHLGCGRVPDQVCRKKNGSQQQEQMNQHAGYVKHQKAAGPENEQQQKNHKE
jgi:hypothetical protein